VVIIAYKSLRRFLNVSDSDVLGCRDPHAKSAEIVAPLALITWANGVTGSAILIHLVKSTTAD